MQHTVTGGDNVAWFKDSRWRIGPRINIDTTISGLYSKEDMACPDSDGGSWEYYSKEWREAGKDVVVLKYLGTGSHLNRDKIKSNLCVPGIQRTVLST